MDGLNVDAAIERFAEMFESLPMDVRSVAAQDILNGMGVRSEDA